MLSQDVLGILIVGAFAGFQLTDLDFLLFKLLVVAALFFDETAEDRSRDCELGRGGHFEFAFDQLRVSELGSSDQSNVAVDVSDV